MKLCPFLFLNNITRTGQQNGRSILLLWVCSNPTNTGKRQIWHWQTADRFFCCGKTSPSKKRQSLGTFGKSQSLGGLLRNFNFVLRDFKKPVLRDWLFCPYGLQKSHSLRTGFSLKDSFKKASPYFILQKKNETNKLGGRKSEGAVLWCCIVIHL
jgi:hypothetical protein